MILWANLVADVPPALALAVDPPAQDIMEREPRDSKKGFFCKFIFLFLFVFLNFYSCLFFKNIALEMMIFILLSGLSMGGLSM